MKCGYIEGDDYIARIRSGDENVFCDKPAVRGSYCAEHAEKCLVVSAPRPSKYRRRRYVGGKVRRWQWPNASV